MMKFVRALAIALGLFALAPASAALTASSSSGLLTILMNAKGGETILLAPGSYSIGLSNKSYASTVTISAAGAQFGPWAKISNVRNLTIDGAKWNGPSTDPGGAYALRPVQTVNLHLTNIIWAGRNQVGTAIYSKSGDNNDGLRIDRGTISGFMDGFTMFNVTNYGVTNMAASKLGGDFVKISGTKNGRISGNVLTAPVYAHSHPDFTQFQTRNDNIAITNNRASGSTQFIDDFGYTGSGYLQSNLSIVGNIVVQGGYANWIVFGPNTTGAANDNQVTQGSSGRPLRAFGKMSHSGNMVNGQRID